MLDLMGTTLIAFPSLQVLPFKTYFLPVTQFPNLDVTLGASRFPSPHAQRSIEVLPSLSLCSVSTKYSLLAMPLSKSVSVPFLLGLSCHPHCFPVVFTQSEQYFSVLLIIFPLFEAIISPSFIASNFVIHLHKSPLSLFTRLYSSFLITILTASTDIMSGLSAS